MIETVTATPTDHERAGSPALRQGETRAILLRDKYRCTEQVAHRLSGRVGRCPVVGSEMLVVEGRAMCPTHARQWREQHTGRGQR